MNIDSMTHEQVNFSGNVQDTFTVKVKSEL